MASNSEHQLTWVMRIKERVAGPLSKLANGAGSAYQKVSRLASGLGSTEGWVNRLKSATSRASIADWISKAHDRVKAINDSLARTKGHVDHINQGKGMRMLAEEASHGHVQVSHLNEQIEHSNWLIHQLKHAALHLFAGLSLAGAMHEVVHATAQMEGLSNAIVYASGSAHEGEKTLHFLEQRADQLGLDVVGMAEGYKSFGGALRGTNLTAQQGRQIYNQVSTAISAMNLNTEDAKGVFLALGQMMSKGTVSAEELRGQIGERIPGAFSMAAKAMGVTEKQLNKLLETGQIAAVDFVPKFAKVLESEFAGALGASTNSLQANINRWNNSLHHLAVTVGQMLKPVMLDLLKIGTAVVHFFVEHSEIIRFTIKLLVVYVAGWAAYRSVILATNIATKAMVYLQGILRIAMLLSTRGIQGATIAMRAFNMATKANPLGLLLGVVTMVMTSVNLFADSTDEATKAQHRFNSALDETAESLDKLRMKYQTATQARDEWWRKRKAPGDEMRNAVNDITVRFGNQDLARPHQIDQMQQDYVKLLRELEDNRYKVLTYERMLLQKNTNGHTFGLAEVNNKVMRYSYDQFGMDQGEMNKLLAHLRRMIGAKEDGSDEDKVLSEREKKIKAKAEGKENEIQASDSRVQHVTQNLTVNQNFDLDAEMSQVQRITQEVLKIIVNASRDAIIIAGKTS